MSDPLMWGLAVSQVALSSAYILHLIWHKIGGR